MENFQSVPSKVIDSESSLLSLLNDLERSSCATLTRQPDLFFDCEGTNLGRHGSLSILTIFVKSLNIVSLVDIQKLGSEAFLAGNKNGLSLKTVLESSTIRKAVFDIRNDSDALYSLYQVSVSGIEDVQLMELATRKGSQKWLAGLTKCVEAEMDENMKVSWKKVKAIAKETNYTAFEKRPISPETQQYCAQDTTVLAKLYDVYQRRLQPPGQAFWRNQVEIATTNRIKQSRSVGYDGHSDIKAQGPWEKYEIEEAVDQWNDDILDEHFNGSYGDDDFEYGFNDPDEYDDFGDTARDCIGWEEDMIMRGSPF